jgi:hypothetical protein
LSLLAFPFRDRLLSLDRASVEEPPHGHDGHRWWTVGAPVTWHTLDKGIFISVLTSAASAAASGAPFVRPPLPDLVLERELADLAFGVPQSSVFGLSTRTGSTLQALAATLEELISSGGNPVGLDTELSAELFELRASE